MPRPRVAIGSMGGTITMTSDTGLAVAPSLTADHLLDAIPQLEPLAVLEPSTLAQLPGASIGYTVLLDALTWARKAVDDGARGIVLIQGTDSLEETAYLLDLYWDRPAPLVVTGAMRSPQRVGADGPANILASVLTVCEPRARGLGVLVAMNDELHAAARVVKGDTSAPNAFHSPVFGPVGRIVEGRVVLGNPLPRHPPLSIPGPCPEAEPLVALLPTYLGDQGELLRLVVNDGSHGGIVIAGFGVGHVPAPLASIIEEAATQLTVVLSSRISAGPTATSTYGFEGGEVDLIRRGAIPAGWLSASKARLLLWGLLRDDSPADRIHTEFLMRGSNPGGPSPRMTTDDNSRRACR